MQVNPGLLALSHGGVCCIDCIDKIDQIQGSIIEVIERKKLSVAKKGIFEEFDADCTIIASVEPRGNKLNPKKTILENMLLDETLVNKFDMVLLFEEEERAKDTKKAKQEFCVHIQPNKKMLHEKNDSLQRTQQIIEYINENMDECCQMITKNQSTEKSRLGCNQEKYSDRLKNIIWTLKLENTVDQSTIGDYLRQARDGYKPK